MKRPDIEKLKQLCNKTTPAPWKILDCIPYVLGGNNLNTHVVEFAGSKNMIKNAEFIAEARQAVPELIEYIEQLEERNKVLTQALTSIHNATLPSAVITKSKLVQIHNTTKGALNND